MLTIPADPDRRYPNAVSDWRAAPNNNPTTTAPSH
jgi:hypothetical protein